MANRLGQLALEESLNPSTKCHYELLRMIDQLRLAVETPTETTLRLIYQVYSPAYGKIFSLHKPSCIH